MYMNIPPRQVAKSIVTVSVWNLRMHSPKTLNVLPDSIIIIRTLATQAFSELLVGGGWLHTIVYTIPRRSGEQEGYPEKVLRFLSDVGDPGLNGFSRLYRDKRFSRCTCDNKTCAVNSKNPAARIRIEKLK